MVSPLVMYLAGSAHRQTSKQQVSQDHVWTHYRFIIRS